MPERISCNFGLDDWSTSVNTSFDDSMPGCQRRGPRAIANCQTAVHTRLCIRGFYRNNYGVSCLNFSQRGEYCAGSVRLAPKRCLSLRDVSSRLRLLEAPARLHCSRLQFLAGLAGPRRKHRPPLQLAGPARVESDCKPFLVLLLHYVPKFFSDPPLSCWLYGLSSLYLLVRRFIRIHRTLLMTPRLRNRRPPARLLCWPAL